MSRSASRFVRSLTPLSVAAMLGISTVPAMAQTAPAITTSGDCSSIDFQLANPAPGSRVEAGNDIVQGIALDTRAPAGQDGIDRVDFFLGNRDQGGTIVGTAMPGMTSGPFGRGSFETTLSMPSTMVGGQDLVAYAHDSVTGQESIISEPIALGEDPSVAFGTTAPPETATETCTPTTGTPTTTTTTSPATTTVTPPAPATTTTTTTATAPTAQSITLQVANPSSGDTIHSGGYVIQGVAFDKEAQSGSAIQSLSIFLDNRDQGGTFLGAASMGQNNMWTATISVPSTNLGLHTLWFYATSSVTGQEMAVSIPVTTAP